MTESSRQPAPPSTDPIGARRVLVGVSGGIAAYKSAELVRRLRERGAEVRVVMTSGAQAFITPLTLQAVSGHRVHTELLDAEAEAGMGHIELARWADDVLVAPATADLIARAAIGRADDLLTTVLLATEARVWMAPAMNRVMWAHPAVVDNCSRLQARGVVLLGPGSGDQACGEIGAGRMLEPEAIAAAVLGASDRPAPGRLSGTRFVVTAGPTHEPLDPVRFLGNRSSGAMGFAVASALARADAEVVLVAGPVERATPAGVRRVDVTTAEQMRAAVFDALPADGFVGVAAVADFRPAEVADSKIKKDGRSRVLDLVPNPDILAEVAVSEPRPFTVGFAAETDMVEANARAKLAAKRLDLIVANRVGTDRGFGDGDSALHVIAADRDWPLASAAKSRLAAQLVDLIIERMERPR
ncbi:bifunctional phosphopantothenoylcysteine decarboxylase/phosphopantothenate--cysteine ligase CoaBC [Wenzhouxiangella sp. XN79A]|uniref:bifunctional phosphopantothenoylcysteine decarboxylase/phosphopantothenate--cysteine ligase CoaBC n=1 Tax=Wenzhouxiangella sp. XN79A TaxID=2724193 RepID=UPI001F0D985A|nr:bifunctional phosphopantothenoylcysteine decarboxylase/phosphopantothenate--cysteine ligase CoaBC [Wenzhouxiangella sp. XN79A]